ncbi:MAG: response regulator [Polyangiaceae bacterium]|nr:response regulator [Polyangiaceae bacterium]
MIKLAEALEASAQPRRPWGAPEFATDGRRVLLVDDDPVLLALLELGLERDGFELTLADDPMVALELIERSSPRFGVLVTDSTMPRMSGLELARSARKLDPSIGIILHSGADHEADPNIDVRVQKGADLSHLSRALTLLFDQP